MSIPYELMKNKISHDYYCQIVVHTICQGIGVPHMKPIVTCDDNQSCISLSKKPNLSCSHEAYQNSSSFDAKTY